MAQNSPDPAWFGSVSIEPMEPSPAEREAGLEHKSRYTWHPPDRLRGQLTGDFSIAFDCFGQPGGPRTFIPVGGGSAYVDWAFMAGLEIMSDVKSLSRQQHHSYLAMRLLFQRVRHMQAHLDRRFDAARDLYIRPRGRPAADDFSVLPADVGLDAAGNGEPWSIHELTTHGREAAQSSGIARPMCQQCVHYGLVAAAQLRPLFLADSEIPTLIRNALFDASALGPDQPASATIELVHERLLGAVRQHFDDSNDAFDAWFMPGKGNLSKLLAGTSKKPGGKLAIADVDRVLLAQGWKAYEYMTGCLHAVGCYFEQALGNQLTAEDRVRFEQMYLPQPCFGNLPLVLLLERAPLLRSVIPRLWEDPTDRQVLGTLHRLLQWYAQMNDKRRHVDRLSKRAPPPRQVAPDANRTSTGSQVRTPGATQNQGVNLAMLQEIFGVIFEHRQISCLSCRASLHGELEGEVASGQPVHLTAWCPKHGQVAECTVCWNEIEAARASITDA